MIVAFTGHRPDKIEHRINEVSEAIRSFLVSHDVDRVISGMALGVDQLAAGWCRRLRIPWSAYLPYPGQEARWPDLNRQMYHLLLEDASDIVIVSEAYEGPWTFQRRNEAMVDACDLLVGVWDGSSGGTANCIRYAERIGRDTRLLEWNGGRGEDR